MNNYCIPSDFSKDTLKRLLEINKKSKTHRVYETYGQISNGFFPSGRKKSVSTDMKGLEEYIGLSHELGIKFNYVFNGFSYSNFEFTKKGINNIRLFIRELGKIGTDSITVTIPAVIEIIREENSKIDIVVSTINQIDEVEIAKLYENEMVNRIVIGEQRNRNIPFLRSLRKNTKCDLEIIANSVCFIKCPWRMFHYNQIAESFTSNQKNQVADTYYTHKCFLRRISNPINYLKLAFIRPEDIVHYRNAGINFFKLQGRQFVDQADIIKTLKIYFAESYEGNLMNLLNCFIKKNEEVYIDNKMMNGFLEPFLNHDFCQNGCLGCSHCADFFQKACMTNLSELEVISKYLIKNRTFTQFLKECE